METKTIDNIIDDCEISLFGEARRLLKTKSISEYLSENMINLNEAVRKVISKNQVNNLQNCTNSLMLLVDSDYHWRLTSPNRCKIHWLCPICASKRAVKKATEANIRTNQIMVGNPKFRAYFIVLTAPNHDDLDSAFDNTAGSLRKYLTKRRNANSAIKGTKKNKYALNSAISSISGGFYSIEVKRGINSGQWHPHVNLLLLTEKPIIFKKFKREWEDLSGGTNIHFELLPYPIAPKTFFEIFKYSLKFQEMAIPDILEAYSILKGRRMTGSFGCLRGIDIPKKSFNDKEIIDTRLYQFDGRFFNKL